MQTCGVCGKRRRDSSFYPDPRHNGKLRSYCKECARAQRKNWYRTHRAHRMVTSNAYRRANRERYLVIAARNRAKHKGIEFNLTVEDIFIPETCPLLGIELFRGNGVLRDSSPTLDRIDPNIGYLPQNVWVISSKANRIKQDATWQEIEMIALALRKRVGA